MLRAFSVNLIPISFKLYESKINYTSVYASVKERQINLTFLKLNSYILKCSLSLCLTICQKVVVWHKLGLLLESKLMCLIRIKHVAWMRVGYAVICSLILQLPDDCTWIWVYTADKNIIHLLHWQTAKQLYHLLTQSSPSCFIKLPRICIICWPILVSVVSSSCLWFLALLWFEFCHFLCEISLKNNHLQH